MLSSNRVLLAQSTENPSVFNNTHVTPSSVVYLPNNHATQDCGTIYPTGAAVPAPDNEIHQGPFLGFGTVAHTTNTYNDGFANPLPMMPFDTFPQPLAINNRDVPFLQDITPPAPAPLRCEWRGCTYFHTFNRHADLLRHVKNLHVTPRSYACPICDRRFNQSYNMRNHIRTHYLRPSGYPGTF
ncbi:hypothetical protein BO78DRAFT_415700 [Aspergillus sclerotiicarbonarius CBS 121057]|uniref:C2H2-type domain-containing protein n=1 Tax=Aspergillus sclerotiicarbonarius (strain CBS 121057 / IBT 28362) TaxID=1448318 RepID=A0A319FLJ0_ASPSB|nr:hypothetical protein BO78DRAFT_415700 [Aspergillus sclerotiicarbonarius CBS 121057]